MFDAFAVCLKNLFTDNHKLKNSTFLVYHISIAANSEKAFSKHYHKYSTYIILSWELYYDYYDYSIIRIPWSA